MNNDNNTDNTEDMEHEPVKLISDDIETGEIRSATDAEVRSVATPDVEVRSEASENEEHSDNDDSTEEAKSKIVNKNIVTGKRIKKQI